MRPFGSSDLSRIEHVSNIDLTIEVSQSGNVTDSSVIFDVETISTE